MQFAYNYLFEVINQLLDRQKKGKHKGIRYISSINNDNLELAKILINCGVQLKHVNNLPPMSFVVSDKEMGATLENLEDGNAIQSLLISNEPLYIKYFASIFENFGKMELHMPHTVSKFASKSVQGTGLGLFISKSIIEAHSGRIWAENNSDGKRATFTFILPLSIAH